MSRQFRTAGAELHVGLFIHRGKKVLSSCYTQSVANNRPSYIPALPLEWDKTECIEAEGVAWSKAVVRGISMYIQSHHPWLPFCSFLIRPPHEVRHG
jgi:hypothetical protein